RSLQLFALVQVALGEPLNLHWLHKVHIYPPNLMHHLYRVFKLLSVLFVRFLDTDLLIFWRNIHHFWSHRNLPQVAKRMADWSKFLIAVIFVVLSAAIFLCPLCIHSPCLIEPNKLPEKPKLFGHRGAPMLAPENTMMSFNRSIACGVTAFETDVQLSKDRIPFLMHDNNPGFLRRTTNVKEKFPNKDFSHSTNLTWKELQSLNAGEWFLKTDPFHSVSKLSEEEMETARNQTIPSLLQLLHLAKQHNVSVLFDLYSSNQENDTVDTVNTILSSGIDPSLVLWLPPAEREYVNKTIPVFQYTSVFVHLHCNLNKVLHLRHLRSRRVTVNLWVVNEGWLFSLLWCAGASSVTTNSCHLLKDMDGPDWVMVNYCHNKSLSLLSQHFPNPVANSSNLLSQTKIFSFQYHKNKMKINRSGTRRSLGLFA
uniref:Glycerophosphodiester phosphodiesterase domain containing 2 n=1 Tax=Cyclopterus lumpus TaxID=8103 RepID=A0A8C3G9C0_CYCLU